MPALEFGAFTHPRRCVFATQSFDLAARGGVVAIHDPGMSNHTIPTRRIDALCGSGSGVHS